MTGLWNATRSRTYGVGSQDFSRIRREVQRVQADMTVAGETTDALLQVSHRLTVAIDSSDADGSVSLAESMKGTRVLRSEVPHGSVNAQRLLVAALVLSSQLLSAAGRAAQALDLAWEARDSSLPLLKDGNLEKGLSATALAELNLARRLSETGVRDAAAEASGQAV